MFFKILCALDESSLSIERVNPFDAVATFLQGARPQKSMKKTIPCHNSIHWKALVKNYPTSDNAAGFQSYIHFFCIILYWVN